MADLSALASSSSTAQSLSNLILVTPDDNLGYKSQSDSKSFLFQYETENSVTVESDITDHVIENNSTIQDQISLKPEKIAVTGFIGELNDIVPPALKALKTAADKLARLSPFTPGLSITALETYNAAALVYATAAAAATAGLSVWNSHALAGRSGAPTKDPVTGLILPKVQNKQQQAFVTLYGYWKARVLFTVQTPWAIFDSMAIQTMRAVQEEDTRMISSFEISFKKIIYAKTKSGKIVIKQARRANQAAVLSDNGTSPGTPDLLASPSVFQSGGIPS